MPKNPTPKPSMADDLREAARVATISAHFYKMAGETEMQKKRLDLARRLESYAVQAADR
jgi:hypothetical protein